jgi:hypothetical protein
VLGFRPASMDSRVIGGAKCDLGGTLSWCRQVLSPAVVEIRVGESAQLRFVGLGSGCEKVAYQQGEALLWSVADSTVATVDGSGVVLGLRLGSTTVRASVVRDLALTEAAQVTVH